MLKVRGLSIEPRSSTICIDLAIHVQVVKDELVINCIIIVSYVQWQELENEANCS